MIDCIIMYLYSNSLLALLMNVQEFGNLLEASVHACTACMQ